MSAAADWQAALATEIGPLLEALGRGDDVPPAQRYRAEGFARAIVALGIAGHDEVVATLRGLYAAMPGPAVPVAADFEETDENGLRRPRVPAWWPRAPVYPGPAAS